MKIPVPISYSKNDEELYDLRILTQKYVIRTVTQAIYCTKKYSIYKSIGIETLSTEISLKLLSHGS